MMNIKRKKTIRAESSGFAENEYFDGHYYVSYITDKDSGLKAFVAVHNNNRGMAHGGTRAMIYENDQDALNDVLRLSKAMSYKSALAGLPYGGAKGVIIFDKNSIRNRDQILLKYAERVEGMGGLFRTGTDVGLTDQDVMMMSKYSKYMLGFARSEILGLSTSTSAAMGTFMAIQASAKFSLGTDNLQGVKIGVKGLGKLGGELVRLLVEAGASVIISDINKDRVASILAQYGNLEAVDNSTIHSEKMDIYAPCALGYEFDNKVVNELNCRVIAGGANNQLLSDSIGTTLYKKGILYAPDYIVNAGGLIYVSEELEQDGFKEERILSRLNNIPVVLEKIYNESKVTNTPTYLIADKMAKEIIYG